VLSSPSQSRKSISAPQQQKLETQRRETTMTSFTDLLLSLWRLSWFGIFGGFLFVGIAEFRHETPRGGGVAHFTVALLIVVTLAWIVFFAVYSRMRTREPIVVSLLTLMGTLLAVFTLLGTYFFVTIASRVP
jgi:cation transport ATPase